MLHIHPEMVIPETEIMETFVRASGPGGQHVNKASTAVQLRFDAASSPSLPEPVRHRGGPVPQSETQPGRRPASAGRTDSEGGGGAAQTKVDPTDRSRAEPAAFGQAPASPTQTEPAETRSQAGMTEDP
jgi:hypothetical protein